MYLPPKYLKDSLRATNINIDSNDSGTRPQSNTPESYIDLTIHDHNDVQTTTNSSDALSNTNVSLDAMFKEVQEVKDILLTHVHSTS